MTENEGHARFYVGVAACIWALTWFELGYAAMLACVVSWTCGICTEHFLVLKRKTKEGGA